MLGWFKKKFGRKKKAEPEVVEVPQIEVSLDVEIEESIAPEVPPVVETPEVERSELPAVEKKGTEEDTQPDIEQVEVLPEPKEEKELPAEKVEVVTEVVLESEAEEEPKPADAQPEIAEEAEEIFPVSEAEVDVQVSAKPGEVPVKDEPELDAATEPEDASVVDTEEEVAGSKDALDVPSREADAAPEVDTTVAEEREDAEPVDTVDVAEPVLAAEAKDSVEELDEGISLEAEQAPIAEEPLDGEEELAEDAPPEAEEEVEPVAPVKQKESSPSLFKRLHQRLGKTRDSFVHRIDSLFLGRKEIDQELFDDLEEILITADLGVETTMDLLEHARRTVKRDQLSDPRSLKKVLRDRIHSYIKSSDQAAELVMPDKGPFVIMVIGVNGVGKTTTIGKIANKFVNAGQSVLLVAGDTFRAAAIDQLKIWGNRVGVEVVAQQPGSDPSSVVFDGMEYGIAHKFDVIIIDTAGRLHTSVNLMQELKKIKRVIGKKLPKAPHEVMLVLDATTGQNGISQAKLFDAAVDVTGLTMSKLDGTAKGGIVATICREMKIPVRFIGIGEQMDDLRDFDSREFVDALFADQEEE